LALDASTNEVSSKYDLTEFLDVIQLAEETEGDAEITAFIFTINHALLVNVNQLTSEVKIMNQFKFEEDLFVDIMGKNVIFVYKGQKQEYKLMSGFDCEVVQMHVKKAQSYKL